MSIDKSIISGKEHRKQYTDQRILFVQCRNHGNCEWCHSNRTHKNDKRELAADQELNEYERDYF